jgi:tRNA 2-thiouridine synthesizing protein E
MAQATIAGNVVSVNDEGYFTEPSQWTEAIAHEMAGEYGILLTAKHLEVLHYLRDTFNAGVPLTIRKVGKSGIVDIKGLYELFPGGPLKISSKLAGIPKPASCV